MSKRRDFIKRTAPVGNAIATTPSFGFHFLKKPKLDEEIIGHGEYRHKIIRDWAQIGLTRSLLNCHEMVMDCKGRLIMINDYTSNNILIFNKSGEVLDYWGSAYPRGHDNVNKNYYLSNTHGVDIDYRDENNTMVVYTSRIDNAFKFFTLEGTYVKTLNLPNMQVCRPVFDDVNLYAGVCWSQPKNQSIKANEGHTGFITILEGDKVISNPEGPQTEYKDGVLQNSYQLENKPILHGHDVCVDEDKNVSVCQWNANRTPPLKLERV